ncbi:MAG TPA: RidA family protein [Streptosporangiaceae bacterium]|nr:RidA family protein [Streptosporangiaceae bacterium]
MTIDRTPSAIGWSFSDVVSVSGPGRWLHVSGQVAFDKNGEVHGSVGEQSHGCFDHIEAVLARAGAALEHVVRITVYLTDLTDYAEFSAARAERFAGHLPASSAVQVAGLLVGATVEIDAVAFVPDAG